MNLQTTIHLYCQAAGGQAEVAERNDSGTKHMLYRRQTGRDRVRKSVSPRVQDVDQEKKTAKDWESVAPRMTEKAKQGTNPRLETDRRATNPRVKPVFGAAKRLCTNCSPGHLGGISPTEDLDTDEGKPITRNKRRRQYPFVSAPGTQPLQAPLQGMEIQAVILHKGTQWCVYSEDRSKNLGCGPTRTWAHRRLAQVEHFKRQG